MGSIVSSTEKTHEQLNRIERIINGAYRSAPIGYVFEILREMQGVTANNKLKWNDLFHNRRGLFAGIRLEHLRDSTMWGVDREKRLFVVMKRSIGLVTIYQKDAQHGDCSSTRADLLNPLSPDFFVKLRLSMIVPLVPGLAKQRVSLPLRCHSAPPINESPPRAV